MTFSACSSGRPQYSQRTAARQAADYRLRGFKAAQSVRCPYGDRDHFHVVTKADDPLLAAVRAFDEQRARSAAMVSGMSHFGGG